MHLGAISEKHRRTGSTLILCNMHNALMVPFCSTGWTLRLEGWSRLLTLLWNSMAKSMRRRCDVDATSMRRLGGHQHLSTLAQHTKCTRDQLPFRAKGQQRSKTGRPVRNRGLRYSVTEKRQKWKWFGKQNFLFRHGWSLSPWGNRQSWERKEYPWSAPTTCPREGLKPVSMGRKCLLHFWQTWNTPKKCSWNVTVDRWNLRTCATPPLARNCEQLLNTSKGSGALEKWERRTLCCLHLFITMCVFRAGLCA